MVNLRQNISRDISVCRGSITNCLHNVILVALAKDLVVIREDISVADRIIVDTRDNFGTTLCGNINFLDPALDVLLRGEIKHSEHLGAVANVRGANIAAYRTSNVISNRRLRSNHISAATYRCLQSPGPSSPVKDGHPNPRCGSVP